ADARHGCALARFLSFPRTRKYRTSMSLSTLSAIELPLAPRASGLLARQSFRAATRRGLLAKQSFRAATRRGSIAKQGLRAPARPSKARSACFAPALSLASARRSALLLGPHCIAAAAAAMPAGAARWIAPIPPLAHGCAIGGTQAGVAYFSGRKPEKRNAWGAFLLVTFLCASKEK